MGNRYEKSFLDIASKFDAVSSSCGKISQCANTIVETKDAEAICYIVNSISSIISNSEYGKEIKTLAKLLNDSLLEYCGYEYVKNACGEKKECKEDKRTIQELLDELNELVGLDNVKHQVEDLIAYQTVQKLRRQRGFSNTKNTLHMAFTGNPGTGKTTVARIVGYIYKQIGLLSKGHFTEVSRTDLIAGYQGQTALKVKKVIEEAKGGVLFIDEAYSITENDHSDSYGRECLTELTKALEDYRDDLVVIVAGYTEPMKLFFQSNPGLKSRFNIFLEFDDYSAEQLIQILESLCKKNDYQLDEELKDYIEEYFIHEITLKNEHFANGRLARNIYDDLVMNHARRIYKIENPTDIELTILLKADFNREKYFNETDNGVGSEIE